MYSFAVNGASRIAQSCCSQARGLPLLLAILLGANGCAAVTNPVGDAIRVRHVPPELLATSKECEQTIPLSLLRQPPVKTYRLGAGDVLGVYIETILGDKNQPFPMHVAPPVQFRDQRRLTPSSGFPIEVQENGSIVLPSVAPLKVAGLSLNEARDAVRNLYLAKKLIQPENDRVFVTLLQARQYKVVVLRQETGAFTVGPYGPIASSKRSTGHVVDLPAYENDVLHALAQTGGLPGLDAYNQIIIQRDGLHDDGDREAFLKQIEKTPAGANPLNTVGARGDIVRIPLRLPAGEPLPIRLDDVVLHTGDVVFLEARVDRWFYTGGLLPTGKFELPRDVNLDVVEAVAMVRGPLLNGSFGGSNLSGDLVKPGLGNPSATQLVVVRRTPGGGQVPIRVDLGRALRDPHERIFVKADDVLLLQETPDQAFARYFSQTFMNFDVFWKVFRSNTATGVLDVAAPDRIPGRVGILNGVPLN
jgi:protein involved in polysaccharide export with SLBB domain